jgi:hypothetical protein
VRKPSTKLNEKDVVDFVKARVSTIKHLTGGAAFVDAIPKNPVRQSTHSKLVELVFADTSLTEGMNSQGRFYDGSCANRPRERQARNYELASPCGISPVHNALFAINDHQ